MKSFVNRHPGLTLALVILAASVADALTGCGDPACTDGSCDPQPTDDGGGNDKDTGDKTDTGTNEDAQTGDDAGKDDGGGQVADCSALDIVKGTWYPRDSTTCGILGGTMEVKVTAVVGTCDMAFSGQCNAINATLHEVALPFTAELKDEQGTMDLWFRIEAGLLLIDVTDNGTFMGTMTYGRTAP